MPDDVQWFPAQRVTIVTINNQFSGQADHIIMLQWTSAYDTGS